MTNTNKAHSKGNVFRFFSILFLVAVFNSTGRLNAQCTQYTVEIVLEGACPQAVQITWQLIGSDGTLWLSGGSPFSQVVCLPDDCYTLNMLDTGGDGWECADWFISDFTGDFDFDTNLPDGNFGTDQFETGTGDCAGGGGGGGGGGCPVGTNQYDLDVTDGDFPDEISWTLSLGGITVISGGADANLTLCLDDGCYVFEMFDSAGNGWNDAEYELKDDNGNSLYLGTLAAGSSDFVVFNLGGLDCTDVVPGGGGGGGGGGSGGGGGGGAGCGASQPGSDCGAAACACDTYTFQISPSGFGTFNEIPSPGSTSNPNYNGAPPWGGTDWGCLLAGELNSNWIMFTVSTSGILQFSFGQNSNGGQFGFYDWAMWQYNGVTTCSAIAGNTQAPVRCLWNATTVGGTGLANPLPAGGNAGNYGPPLNVVAGSQYIICMSNWSFVNATVVLDFFGTAVIDCNLFLPVELISFDAQPSGKNVAVTWTTMSEVNNHHFEIEHSMDGYEWELAGIVAGSGNTSQAVHYSFMHANPDAGWNYYRLKQVDINGAFKMVGPASVYFVQNEVLLFPNPARQEVFLSGLSGLTLRCDLHDPSGRMIRTWMLNQDDPRMLNLGGIHAGLYILHIISEQGTFNRSVEIDP